MLFAENTANYDADDSGNFGLESVFAAANHVQSTDPAASLFTSLTAPGARLDPARRIRRPNRARAP